MTKMLIDAAARLQIRLQNQRAFIATAYGPVELFPLPELEPDPELFAASVASVVFPFDCARVAMRRRRRSSVLGESEPDPCGRSI